MAYCLFSFGSNLGDRRALVAEAARCLRADGGLRDFRFSRLFETPPIGGPDGQSVFINAAAVAQTDYRARDVLSLLQSIELKLGRVRQQRWDARSIDLDLVLYGDWIGSDLRLTLPHPRLSARAFVLKPAMDVAAEWREPRSGWTIQELGEHLEAAPPSLALTGGNHLLRTTICDLLQAQASSLASPLAILRRPTFVPDQPMVLGQATIYQQTEFARSHPDPVPPTSGRWISDFVPQWPPVDRMLAPRVIARINPTGADTWWPEPRRMWRNGWKWPEYQLDAVDAKQAASEVLAALAAMECAVEPITTDGNWDL